jgi:hypothetical protein
MWFTAALVVTWLSLSLSPILDFWIYLGLAGCPEFYRQLHPFSLELCWRTSFADS